MTSRVPTTASYRLYMNRMATTKQQISDLSYQSTTGNKYQTYDQYGVSSYRLLSLENEQAITNKFLETNSITQVWLESQQTSVDNIRSAVLDFRNELRNFNSNDLTAISINQSEENLTALSNVQEAAFECMSLLAYYLNTQVDGNYIFGGGITNQKPVDFPFSTLADFQAQYDGKIQTYPTNYSASMTEANTNYEVSGGLELQQLYQTLEPAGYSFYGANDMSYKFEGKTLTASAAAFSSLKPGDVISIDGTFKNDTVYTIDTVSPDGRVLTFTKDVDHYEELLATDGVKITKSADWRFEHLEDKVTGEITNKMYGSVGEFSNLKVGEQIKVENTSLNNGYLTIESISKDGSTLSFKENVETENVAIINELWAQKPTIKQSTYEGELISQNPDSFITNTITCNELQTGDLTFSYRNNAMSSTVKGAFSYYKTGDTVIIENTGKNDGTYVIDSVSADGRTVKFKAVEKHATGNNVYRAVEEDITIPKSINEKEKNITIKNTYSDGATIELSGTNSAYNGKYTVSGVPYINDEGKMVLTIKTDNFPSYGAKTELFNEADIKTQTYYQGGFLTSTYRISETNTISNDTNASSVAFEQIFRALGEICQGNLLDKNNPESAKQRVEDALKLIDNALTENGGAKNSLTSIQYSIITKMDVIQTTIDNQTEMKNSLETYVSNLTQVDRTEAVTYLLQASNNLKTAYSVLTQINSMSLLNYL